MRSFGKAMRNSLPAIGLGLMGVIGMAGVSVVTAPAAVAQKPTEAFVNNYNDARTAYAAKNYSQALSKADAAMAEAQGNQQKGAVAAIRVLCYTATNNYTKLIEAIEAHRALSGNA